MQAKSNITAAVYKFTSEDVYHALKQTIRIRPELTVRLLMNYDTTHDQKDWLEDLRKLGSDVEVKYWRKVSKDDSGKEDTKYDKLHAKLTVCDSFVVLGSANWSDSSCDDNMEISFQTVDGSSARYLDSKFQTLWADAHAQTI